MMGKPKIRFKGYNEDWEQRKFAELAEYKKGPFGSAITKSMFVPKSDDSVKVYEQQNAINKDWSLERYFLPKEYAYTRLKAFEVHSGDIIVSCAGTIGEIYEIPDNAEYGVINQALMRVRVYEKIVDKRMFIIAFSNMINEFTRTHSNGSAIKNIPPFADLKPMKVLMPSMEEQRVISECFEKIDYLITLHQHKCDETKKLKKCMLQKMFPKNGKKVPEIRFDGFANDWEQRKLGKVADIGTGKLDANAMNETGEYDFYTSGIQKYKIDVPAFEGPAITIAGNGATVGYMHLANGKFNAYQRTYVLSAFQANREFLFYEIGNKLPKKISQEARTGNIPYIVMDMLTDLQLSIPCEQEQRKLGEFMMSLDHLITLHQHKCDELQNLKKYMLQNMFV